MTLKKEEKMKETDTDNYSNHSEKESFILDVEADTEPPRESWGNRFEFLLAAIGYTVGIGTIYRFPILCVRNGGGAFLVPFCLVLTFIGGPIYYLEFSLGQFTGKGPCKAFEFCQLFKGTGYLMVTINTSVVWYFMTIMAWILYYLYSSFNSVLPWSTCNNEWNTINCRAMFTRGSHFDTSNLTISNTSTSQLNVTNKTVNPALEFWTNNVLRKSSGLEEIGSVQLHLLIALCISWIITMLALVKGVKSLGKVVYFTALFPYVLLTILLVRGITLDGSTEGLMFFLKFDSSRLMNYQVWLEASVQVFYSLGPIYGGAITMAAHNKFNQSTFKDTLIICTADVVTAVYAALVVFSVIGFMAKEAGVPVEELATSSGPGLAFVAYPTACSLMPLPHLWAVLFFFMMLLVMLDSAVRLFISFFKIMSLDFGNAYVSGPGLAFVAYPTACSLMPLPQLWAVLFFFMMLLVMLDTAFGMVETILISLRDLLPPRLSKHRLAVNTCFGIAMVLSGVIYTTNVGIYLFQLIDWYASAFGFLIGAFLEVTSISLFYGIDRFSKDIKLMIGRDVSRLARVLYCVVIPIISFVTFVLLLTQYSEPNYGDGYVYRPYAIGLGFFVGLLPVVVFVIITLNVLWKQNGSIIEKLKSSLTASDAWGPKDRKVANVYKLEPYIYESTKFKRFKRNLMGDSQTPWL